MRATLSRLLTQAAIADKKAVLLTGDHGYALFDEFRRHCPDQYINCGVAEQNMVGVAAGLAKAGYRPIVYGLAAFVPIRVLEQIKIDVCLEKLPVTFLGDGAGFVYSALGSSHQCFEDIAALCALPHMTIFSPADRAELEHCFAGILARRSPCYLRLGKADLGDVHQDAVVPGEAALCPVLMNESENLCIATGSMVKISRDAITAGALPWDLYSALRLKTADPAEILALCRHYKQIVTVEEHSVHGGLGSLVAQAIAGQLMARFRVLGIQDRFSGECGSYAHLLKYHGLDRDSVSAALRE